MAVDLRPLQTHETRAAAAAWLRARVAAAPAIPLPVHPDEQVLAYFTEQVASRCDVRVAVAEGDIVGVLALRDGWVDHLYVVPERTGDGIGSALLGLAQQLQPGGLQLWTFQSNAGARRFYARHGFLEVEQTDGAGNMERAPDARLVWPGTGAPQPYEAVAVNLDPEVDNRIHSDDVAQQLGFAGALVPGVDVFALASASFVQAWGEGFLGAGRLALRFRKPVYDGDPITVTSSAGEVAVVGPDGGTRATGTAVPPLTPAPPEPYEDRPLPAQLGSAPRLGPKGTVGAPADPVACADYVHRIGDRNRLYAELVHPGLLLRLVNLALMSNVDLGVWIHTFSDCRFLSPARRSEDLAVRSRVTDLFDRRGHSYVRYDALVLANGRPVAEVDHEAIWRLAGQDDALPPQA